MVSAGQRLAALASAQQSEIEVQLPEHITPPTQGAVLFGSESFTLTLRSAAGSADAASLTRQARYSLSSQPAELALGRVLQVQLQLPVSAQQVQVPLGALDERGAQPQLWQVVDGKAQPSAVTVLKLDGEFATVQTSLPAGSKNYHARHTPSEQRHGRAGAEAMSFNLSVLAVRERAITLFFILLAFIGGVWAFLSLGRAEDPSFTIRAMIVSVYWPGATAEEMQAQLADRLEKRIQEVRNIHKIDSQIRPGAANLTIEFKDYTPSSMVPDLFYQIRKRMQEEATSMPAGVIGPVVNDTFSDVYFSLLSLSAPGLPFRDLSRQAESLRDELSMVPGVLKAVIIADRPERIYIDFDQNKLAALGVSQTEVQQQLSAASRLLPAGQIETKGPGLQLRVDARTDSFTELQQLSLRVGGKLVKLSDVALVHRGYEEPARLLARTGGDAAVLVGVVMQPGENGLVLGKALQQKLQDIQAQLPLGIELHQLTNQAEAISKAVDLFEIKFLVAVLVVMAVSVLAIGLRAGLVVGIAIPLTLGITFLLMKMVDINLDRITLGALSSRSVYWSTMPLSPSK